MSSSNKVRRYLQNPKPSSNSTTQYLVVDPTISMNNMRKYQGKPCQTAPAIPQICVDNNDEENNNSLRNEVKRSAVLRALSLKPDEFNGLMTVPTPQTRSFSFSLGSSSSERESTDHSLLPSAMPKSTSSRETLSRLIHSLTFRSGTRNNEAQTIPCLACRDESNLDLIIKSKKRPSIFGVLAAKLNTTNSNETTKFYCSVCKRTLTKTNSNHESPRKIHHDSETNETLFRTKRRRSLPSLFQTLLESSSGQRRPSTSTIIDPFRSERKSVSIFTQSHSSLFDSDESSYRRSSVHPDEPTFYIDQNENDQDQTSTTAADPGHGLDESFYESPMKPLFLHPPEEKTRSLLVNVFRTRRSSNTAAPKSTMATRQFSVSVINLASSISGHRRNSAIVQESQTPIETRKHAMSDENLRTMDQTSIYFSNPNGESFKENLNYSKISENTSLREVLSKLFEKHHLAIENHQICLRTAPTLPLSLDQPVKHILLDDLIVREVSCLRQQVKIRGAVGKDKSEKRYSIGSTIFTANSKAVAKRLSTHCIMLDHDDNSPIIRTNKSVRSGLFTSGLFTRDLVESIDTNLAFVRRKCDEWLSHGLPKLAQLHISIDESDLIIDKEWQRFLSEQARASMSESTILQQEAIYEMLTTEVSYIRQILTMTDVFMTSISILKSSERDTIFNDINMDKLFSNIQQVIEGNLRFWKDILLPVKVKLEQTGSIMNPSEFKEGFLQFEFYFQSYLAYVLDQKSSAEYFKQKFTRDDLFQYLITWIEANFTNRLSFSDLAIKPLQRLTRYKLLLEAIQRKTLDAQQRSDLQEMIEKVAMFVNQVNSRLDCQEQEERLRQINDRIGPFEYIAAPPELTAILQEYHRDTLSNRLDLLQDIPLLVPGYRRQIIQQGPMKMKDAKTNQDVYCYLFSDLFLITKPGKRTGSTNSSLMNNVNTNENPSNRSSSSIINKILKAPIRIDRFDVREYDRRGGNNNSQEPLNTASFIGLVYSEYNLMECAYLFQTNLSKQWIENIRMTKTQFQCLLEESKIKLQQAVEPANAMEIPLLQLNPASDESSRRSSKVESEVFKIVEQTRRNSRTDRKNFGRYFTADGTATSQVAESAENQAPNVTMQKRMSWNNEQLTEKADSLLITNSFRSVHSSSGVSSTGSFLFSNDEDSSLATTTTTSSSVPSMVPVNKSDENDSLTTVPSDSENKSISESIEIVHLRSEDPSFRRSTYATVKRRHLSNYSSMSTQRNDDVFHSMNVYRSVNASGNESDYDNNHPATQPYQRHRNHSNSSQSDRSSTTVSSSPHPLNFKENLPHFQDPLITRRLLDIRSHLLLNTTLDATEV